MNSRQTIVPILDVTLNRFTRTFDTNVFSIVRMSQAVVPHMAGRKSGLVINVGSIAGIVYVISCLMIGHSADAEDPQCNAV
jgi:short-subunit dehydrogenase